MHLSSEQAEALYIHYQNQDLRTEDISIAIRVSGATIFRTGAYESDFMDSIQLQLCPEPSLTSKFTMRCQAIQIFLATLAANSIPSNTEIMACLKKPSTALVFITTPLDCTIAADWKFYHIIHTQDQGTEPDLYHSGALTADCLSQLSQLAALLQKPGTSRGTGKEEDSTEVQNPRKRANPSDDATKVQYFKRIRR
ncbi:hypothetical protein CALCODRAFT_484123 [Calocera cornea HHB12733]|uniref:Uncharacterized protein n=1 Tax=Calocera cornea HHB12733 TaxID=1353952 RepID=A0A165F579_9BASI|nr:hypothetical protein CALCODRAFT_484123 [Calocera cornea HHB12733]